HLACPPVLIGLPATEQVGSATPFRPAAFASAVIALGFMSGEPVICSSPRLSCTVPRPPRPVIIEPMPIAISTMLAAMPAYLNTCEVMGGSRRWDVGVDGPVDRLQAGRDLEPEQRSPEGGA